MPNRSTQVRDSLQASYKSTRLQLSRILAFKSHLQQHGAAQYGRLPQSMVATLKGEMDKFDQVCVELEQRVMRAIATLERDANKSTESLFQPASSTSSSPIPLSDAPMLPPSSALPLTITSASQAIGPETITIEEDEPSASVPQRRGQKIELDLTLSPTPPPAPAPSLPDDLPFALPTSTPTNPPSTSTTTTSTAPVQSSILPSDDLNALLSSLNMPPFDPTNSFLGASTDPSSAGYAPVHGEGRGEGDTAAALAALLGTSSNLPTTTSEIGTGGTTTTTTGGVNLTGFDFSSISSSTLGKNPNPTVPSSTSTSNSTIPGFAPQSSTGGGGGGGTSGIVGMDFDFSQINGLEGMDFSSFGGGGSTVGTGGGGGFNLMGMGLGMDGTGGSGTGEGGQMSEENLEALLKSLGG
ncbi:hypothetical protein JCM16303_006261 [Sporobolomyces ruberrimus]